MGAAVYVREAERSREARRWRDAAALYLLAADVEPIDREIRLFFLGEACEMHDRAQLEEHNRNQDPRRA